MPSMLSFKVLGVSGLASYAVAYTCAKLRHIHYNRYKLIVVSTESLPDMPRGYSARALGPDDLAGLTIDIGPERQAERFANGLICVGAFDRRDALAGVTWIGRHSYDEYELNVHYTLPANAAWDTGLWVPEEKRMGRAFAAVCGALKDWLRREGLDYTFSSIVDYNIASILSHRRLGFRRLGHVIVVRIGGVQFTLGARPFFSIPGRTRTPGLRLRAPDARRTENRRSRTPASA